MVDAIFAPRPPRVGSAPGEPQGVSSPIWQPICHWLWGRMLGRADDLRMRARKRNGLGASQGGERFRRRAIPGNQTVLPSIAFSGGRSLLAIRAGNAFARFDARAQAPHCGQNRLLQLRLSPLERVPSHNQSHARRLGRRAGSARTPSKRFETVAERPPP
jgi:hypothetical protein